MKKTSDYKHIEAWGKMMGSFDSFIKGEQEKAVRENAPLNTVYFRGKEAVTFDQVSSPKIREHFTSLSLS